MSATAEPTTVDLDVVKNRQQTTWASGDYARIGALIVPVAEQLTDAADLRAGWRVLDVATGSGNAAIAARRLGCEVTGIDYVPELLERARERAAAERLDLDLVTGDAEALPFPDGSFDAVLSVYGTMFTPDQRRVASELVRVLRPGGTIALASWTPDGFLGAMFRTIAAHVPPPAGVASPMLWGDESHLEELFGGDVSWAHRVRTFTFRFTSADAFVETFAAYYGPLARSLDAAGSGAGALADGLRDVALEWNRLPQPGPIAIPATYLESVGTRA
jgi:SAM-dependent methyltransferase